jgi:protein phosphatase
LKNVVTRALGGGPSVSPDLRELSFSPRDLFLFCSDGLTTMLGDEEIRDAAADDEDPQSLCRTLVDLANEKGGVDNITVVVVQVPERAASQEVKTASAGKTTGAGAKDKKT